MANTGKPVDKLCDMASQRPGNPNGFEYFLYTAMILETALAAFVYKLIFAGPALTSLMVSLTIIYFGFLAWSIFQLNQLHNRRKLAASAPEAGTFETSTKVEVPSLTAAAMEVVETGGQAGRILGLTAAQVVAVVVVFAAAVVSFSWALSILNPPR
jgi:hypothetical protein